MFFKMEIPLRGIYLEKDLVGIEYGGVHKIHIALRTPTQEERSIGHEEWKPFFIITGEWQPNENVTASFRSLTNMKMPKGSKNKQAWHTCSIDLNGNITVPMSIPLTFLPDPLVSFVNQISQELMDYAKRTVNILRWRGGITGDINPLYSGKSIWSFDGQNWLPLPSYYGKGYDLTAPYLPTSNEILEDVKVYIKEGKNHPLGYELYSEAWGQRHGFPRSALVIGIAAAETGVKHCIGKVAPDAKWLIENVASPDLVKLLSEYLFLLPTINRVNVKVFAPKSVLYESLRKGVSIRNQIVHGRSTTITYETLEEILLAVHDVLWILDYCSGYDWALRYVRQDIRKILEEKSIE